MAAAFLALLAILVLLAIVAPPTKSDQPAVATAVPQGEFEPVWTAGPRGDGTLPSPAVHQSRTSTPAASAPATGPPSARLVPKSEPVRLPAARAAVPAALATGTASWWNSFGPGIYAALPGYIAGTHVTIRVCAGARCVVAPVTTSCGCFVGTPQERIIDLSRDAFARLADPALGLVTVTIEREP